MVLISPGFSMMMDTNEMLNVSDQANRAKIVINTLDARGLYAPTTLGQAEGTALSGEGNIAALQQNIVGQGSQSLVLLSLAQETGGTFFRDSNDIAGGLKQIGAAPEVSYILGFTPQDQKMDGSYHKLKVSVTRLNRFGDPIYETQARRGYFAPKEGGDPKEQSHDELQDALFSQDEIRDLPMELQTQYVRKDAGDGELSIVSRLQMKDVPFQVVDGRHVDSLTLATSIFDENGNFVVGGQKVLDLNLLEASYQKMIQSGLTVKVGFDLKPGRYIVRQVVRDSENSQMAARNGTVVIPN